MKIKITAEEACLIIGDDSLDNDNYVNIKISSDHGEVETDILLSEIMPALIAFDAKRSRRLSDEREY